VRKAIALLAFSVSVLAIVVYGQQSPANPLSNGARLNYQIIKGFVTGRGRKDARRELCISTDAGHP
jgi:hypothetical protein